MSFKFFRKNTLMERSEFYQNKFDIQRVQQELGDRQRFAIVIGRKTHIAPEQWKDYTKGVIYFRVDNYEELKQKLIEFSPESVYYVRNDNEILVDFDPHIIECTECQKTAWESFCIHRFEYIKEQTIRMAEILEQHDLQYKIYYSGRGMHIKITVSNEIISAKKFIISLSDKFTFDINVLFRPLIRLPYSLNALVNRICIPLEPDEVSSFDINDEKVIAFKEVKM